MPEISVPAWDAFLAEMPLHHLLQTSTWGELKTKFGWTVQHLLIVQNGVKIGAQVLFRRIFPGLVMAYLPKGPVYDPVQNAYPPSWQEFWKQIDELCYRRRAIFLKVEPDIWMQTTRPESVSVASSEDSLFPCSPFLPQNVSPPPGFLASPYSIQPPRTLLVSLQGDEERILGRMKQKTRYNIKLAQRRGVVVFPANNIDTFYELMKITGKRDKFSVHSRAYYHQAYELFHQRGQCELLFAEFQEQLLGGVMVFACGLRAWYLYGASSDKFRDMMPTYLLQWEAMRWARARGCSEYDLWGIPDEEDSTLEDHFAQRSQGLWGVYRFKRGFGGLSFRSAGPWDRVYLPAFYSLYQVLMKRKNR